MILRTIDKVEININDEEGKMVLDAIRGGAKYVILKGAYILISSISGIYPESKEIILEKRRDQTKGILHDGTRVKRYFGTNFPLSSGTNSASKIQSPK